MKSEELSVGLVFLWRQRGIAESVEMKITLISPYFDITSIGMRILSSCLKEKGYETKMVFLPQSKGAFQNDFLIKESEQCINDLTEICSDSDVIGITLMTNYYFRAASLTERLKKRLNKPLIWGGVHPTVRPDECLQYADMVITGEGERSLIELVDCMSHGKEPGEVRGLCLKKNGVIKKNSPSPLIQDLDSLPFPDYSIENSYISHNDSIVPMDLPLFEEALLNGMTIEKGKPVYQIITSRGCPLNCSYCCNDIFRKMHRGERYLRVRSTDNIIDELEQAIHYMDFIRGVWISDDCFIYQSPEELDKFAKSYKKRIDLPFFCLGDPIHLTKEKMEVLCDAGLTLMTMGIQSGSGKSKKLFRRNISNERIVETTTIIGGFRNRIKPPMYDIIVDNPFETIEDEYETLELISKIQRPYYLQLFSLTFFPGSTLYNKAVETGIITDDYNQIYNKPYYDKKPTFHNILLRLYNRKIPKVILMILSSKPLYFLLSSKVFAYIYKTADKVRKRSET